MHIYLGLFASLLGLWVATHIYRKKQANTKLVCPRNGCEYVVHSTHATTLGIHNELLGIGFYSVMGLLYTSALLLPWVPLLVSQAMVVLTIVGFAFSLYLIWIQAFVIKHWCYWCLGSAVATLLLVVALCI